MTKIEYIESKRFGMIQLYEKLNEHYINHSNSFTDLKIDDLTKITREIDETNLRKGQKQEIWYKCCDNCKLIEMQQENSKLRGHESLEK